MTGVDFWDISGQITWPDLQRTFRTGLCEALGAEEWNHDLDVAYPPLAHRVTLRLKIDRGRIKEMLEGPWRMYCQPPEGDPFSYGLIIKEVTELDETTFSFTGSSAIKGRYEIVDGRVEYMNDHKRQHVYITYKEVWPSGLVDSLFARMKSNGKFTCESDSGYVQKARHKGTMPEDLDHEDVPLGVKKYFVGDGDGNALAEARGGVGRKVSSTAFYMQCDQCAPYAPPACINPCQ